MSAFTWFPGCWRQVVFRKSDRLPRYYIIMWMSRPLKWSIMIYDMAKMVDKGTADLSTKITSADSPGHFTKRQSIEGGALGAGLKVLVMMR